jgi:serine protease Do
MTTATRFLLLPLLALSFLLATTGTASAERPWLGIYMQNITDELAEAFDLNVKSGILINSVFDESPADEAGLRRGDAIIAWNGKELLDTEMLSDLVNASKIGDAVKLMILRDGEHQDLEIVIGEEKDLPSLPALSKGNFLAYLDNSRPAGLGVSLQPLTGDLGEYFGVENNDGALITEVHEDTPAAAAGLRAGDIITAIGDYRVQLPRDVRELLADYDEGDTVSLTIMRERSTQQLAIEIRESEGYGFKGNWLFPSQPFLQHQFHMPDLQWLNKGENLYFDSGELEAQLEELEDRLQEMQKRLERMKHRLD